GYTGDGTWDVAVVDSGVSLYHPALSAHRESGDPYISTMSNRPDQNHPDDDYGHGTAVAGIIASTDATYKGIAYGIDKIIICKVMTGGYNPVETEVWEAVDWALDASKPPYSYAHETAEIINFSAGFDTVDKYHGYSDSAKFFDAVVDDLHVMVVTSAGNYGDNIEKGNITSPGDMFNGLTVANMDNRNTPQRSDDVAADSSSVGPAGGRKKPDVIAPGTYITTTRRDWFQGFPKFGTGTNGNGGYITFSGTSFAAPHVTGAIALLYDYLSTWPKTLKAVLINTADDWGEQGWDGKHGWGYINLQAALTHWFYDEVGLNPAGSNFDRYYWSCSIDPGEKITAVWNREVDYNYPEPPTVHDLDNIDLFLYDYTGGVKGSLLASSTSTVDNVEQVVYNGTTSKQVLVEVRNMTPNSDAYVSVAFPSPFSRKGYGPYAPPRPVSHQNEPIRNELGQNFPNPFNAETWIPYAIEKEAVVSVQIFDTNGRLVRKLDIGKKPAGCYFSKERAIHWDGRNELGERVPSGVYFYYLTAGEFAATRKMVVLE
ncbi:S8 family serine peptidase, partial [Candidatus Poribacteria bacterium]|nr:S8 family serine peptidase [Candidatus Poribacteria bacterium]